MNPILIMIDSHVYEIDDFIKEVAARGWPLATAARFLAVCEATNQHPSDLLAMQDAFAKQLINQNERLGFRSIGV